MKTHISLIGAAVLLAMTGLVGIAPAAAQGSPAFGLQFGFGVDDDNDDDAFGVFNPPELALCLTDADIRRSVARRGFTNIYLNVKNDKHVQVKATRNGSVYLLDFNFCRDEIEGAQRLRAAR